MNNWNIYRIKDICEIKSGKRLPKGCDFSSTQTQYPYIRARDIKNGKINTNDLAYISQDVQSKIKRYIVNENDIAITIVASIGDVGFVPKELDGFNLTENAVRLTNFHKNVNSKYLCYYLSQPNLKTYMEGFAVGAAQAKLGIYKIEKLKVQLPPLPTQQKIASILSSYDNLIQNYKKQIEALQTAASELYKEWFVRFRFPGWQNAKFENGIPEGWKIDVFSKYSTIMSGGTPSTEITEYYNGDIPFFTPKDWNEDFFSFRTIINITEEGLKHCNSQLYPKDTVIITARGTVGNVILLGVPMAMNQSCFALKSDVLNSPYYLFFVIKNEVLKLKKMANGGVFDTIIIKTFDHIHITIPDNYILSSFNKQIEPMMNRIYSLQQQITNLIQQRDLLLPRLMSGKLEVKK